jgi:transcriptional regulator with XRE-family HTH domain
MDRGEQVAGQLKALMDRHRLTPGEIERRTGANGETPINASTVWRIMTCQHLIEPPPATLRRIAEAVGERYSVAFAEDDEPTTTLDISRRGKRIHVRTLGEPLPPEFDAELKALVARFQRELNATKK